MNKNLCQKNISKLEKIIKYILISIMPIIFINYILNKSISINNLLYIGAINSMSYAILDIISPSVIIYKECNNLNNLVIE